MLELEAVVELQAIVDERRGEPDSLAELNEYEALSALNKLPIAVVGGMDDMVTPIAHTERMVELLPDAEATLLPACGHLGMIEHYEACNAVLDRLVDRAR